MFKEIKVHATFNERTGYGVHASRFFPLLDELVRNAKGTGGEVHISLLDTVTASQVTERHPAPSILYNVWESDSQPDAFMDKLKLYDQLWVPSEWQRAASISQGVPEEFVAVVPEGVDPEVYKPDKELELCRNGKGTTGCEESTFNFLHVGQWQPRKSTKEIVEAFLKAFPGKENVRLYLSADTLFPSDTYGSTEERLKAYGLEDPRIIPVHFEERDAYIRRLQSAHVFVSCSRSEGWGLPIIEAMATGCVTLVADWGGSTEYAGDALLVRVPELIKPFGIYGNWDVPGHWGEPDYSHLVEVMRDAYENYPQHKEKALKTSEVIREKFSWKAAAEKGFKVLEDLQKKMQITPTICREQIVPASEADLRIQARRLGYEITGLKKSSAIFTVDTHPDTEEKLETLKESIGQIKALGYPILVTSHLPLPKEVVESVDFYIYDKKDILSGDDKPSYWRQDGFGKTESTTASKPCHALAAVHNVRNAVDFCRGRYDWIYQMSSDAEVDLREWLDKVHSSDKDMVCIRWEGQPNTVSGQITAARTEAMDKILLRMETWEDFKKVYAEDRFCSERKYFRLIEEHVGLENVEFIDMDVGNRHDQVDWEAWKDDMFTCHFVEGPLLDISGLSKRVYDVVFNDGTRDVYSLKQNAGMWSRPSIKYYKPWTVTASLDGVEKFRHTIDLKGKKVMICMGSKALGDTIAWMPYVEEFRKKHECKVVCSGWWQEIFDYPEIEFIKPGDSIMDLYASYNVGCFDDQLDQNVVNWRSVPLQKVASDILGLDYKPLKAKLKVRSYENEEFPADWKKPYVCFSEYSTMQNKFWNRPGAWQKAIDRLVEMGYTCVSVSAEATQLNNVIKHNGQGIHSTIADIAGAEFYLGLNHGPIWIAYTLGVPAIMISGVSEEWNDFPNPYRIAINKCKPCFNNVDIKIDRDWNWCPGPDRFVCTREITEEMVFEKIDQLRRDLCQSPLKGKAKGTRSGHREGSKQKGRPRKKRSPKEGFSTRLTMDGGPLGATG